MPRLAKQLLLNHLKRFHTNFSKTTNSTVTQEIYRNEIITSDVLGDDMVPGFIAEETGNCRDDLIDI